MARRLALTAAVVAALLPVAGASGADAQTPKRGGTLVFGFPGFPEPACLNPILIRCGGGLPNLDHIVGKVLESPFDVDARFRPRARIVSSVAFTRKRPSTLVYRIRPEARWSDGTPITARDFVFTLRVIRRYGTDENRAVYRAVRSIRAIDAKTVRVVARPRFAYWRWIFAPVLPSHALRNADFASVWNDGIVDSETGEAIGSGPFLVERWERGKEIVLRRNRNYWGGMSHLDRLVIRFTRTPAERVDGVRSGELDIAQGLAPEAIPALRREGLKVHVGRSNGLEHLELRSGDGGHPALKEKLVRRALAYGLDRVALVRTVFRETAPTAQPHDSMLLLGQSGYYEPNWDGYRHRPALARRLLEEAGCHTDADGVYVCAGRRMVLRFYTTGGIAFRERVFDVVARQLREIGVVVVRIFAPPAVFFEQILPAGNFDVLQFTWLPVSDHSSDYAVIYGCGRSRNFTGYCQRLVTADLDQATRILDGRQRALVLNRADRQMARDVPVIPLFQVVPNAVARSDVRGYVLPAFSPFTNAEDWWLDR